MVVPGTLALLLSGQFPPGLEPSTPTHSTTPARPVPQGPESLDWAASATGVEELVLWRLPQSAQETPQTDWVRWAAGLPCLRLVELRVGSELDSDVTETKLVCEATRAEGEGVEGMLLRFVLDLVDAL